MSRPPKRFATTSLCVRSISERCIAVERELTPVDCLVVARHRGGGEALLEYATNAAPIDGADAVQRLDSFVFAVHDEPGNAVVDHLGYRPGVPCNDRRSARH